MKEKDDEIENKIEDADKKETGDKNEIIIEKEEKNETKVIVDWKNIKFSKHSQYPPLIREEKNVQLELMHTYLLLDNKNLKCINNSIDKMTNFEENFLKGPDYAEINDTPIFKLCKIMKKINSIEKKRLNPISHYFKEKEGMIKEFGGFYLKHKKFTEEYEKILNYVNDLNSASYLIEKRLTYKYMRDNHKDKIEDIEEVTITAKEQINKSRDLEKAIRAEKSKIKSIKESPNFYLKQGIKSLKKFSENNKNISDDLKKKIDIIYNESEKEKGKIYKIWDFNEPIFEMPEYQFKLVEDPSIRLKLKDDKIKRFYKLNEQDIDAILSSILGRVVGISERRHLAMYSIGYKLYDTRKITRILINGNHPNVTFTHREVEDRLIKLLDDIQNIKAFMRLINEYSKSLIHLKKEIFNILSNIFQRICYISLFQYDYLIADSLIKLSAQFYKEENKIRRYLLDEIKWLKLFKTETFWVNTLNFRLVSGDENIYSKLKIKEVDDKEADEWAELIFGKINLFDKTFIAFRIPNDSIENIINKVLYKFPQNVRDKVLSKVFDRLKEIKASK